MLRDHAHASSARPHSPARTMHRPPRVVPGPATGERAAATVRRGGGVGHGVQKQKGCMNAVSLVWWPRWRASGLKDVKRLPELRANYNTGSSPRHGAAQPKGWAGFQLRGWWGEVGRYSPSG